MLIRQSAPASAGDFLSEDHMSYEFKAYPAWISKEGEAARLVQTAEEHESLGEGWKLPEHAPFTPVEEGPGWQEYPKWVNGVIVDSAEAEAALLESQPTSERAILLQVAAEKGVKVDGRWSDAKIRAALEAAE
jgi:hypothetical protein